MNASILSSPMETSSDINQFANDDISVKKEKGNGFLEIFPRQLRDKNIIPLLGAKDGEPKKPGFNWGRYQEKPYSKRLLKNHFLKNEPINYAVICGNPLKQEHHLVVLDIDTPSLFEFFKEEDTFIVETPNGGFHVYYYTDSPVKKQVRFLKIPLDLQCEKSYVVIPPSMNGGKSYGVLKDQEIKFIEDLEEHVKSKLPECLVAGETELPDDIKEFKKHLHEKHKLADIVLDHFPEWYDPSPRKEHGNVIRMMNPIAKQESGHASFVIFTKDDRWISYSTSEAGDVIDFIKKVKNFSKFDETLRYLSEKYGINLPQKNHKKSKSVDLVGFEDFFEITKYNERTIEPGCYYHPKEGLMFTSSFSEIPNQLFGISDKNVIKAVDKSYTNVESIPNNTFKFEGYLNPLSPKTRTAIRNLMEKAKKGNKDEIETISSLFESLYKKTEEYLDLKDETLNVKATHVIYVLWIMGTYLRDCFVWYPYLTFYGLRDVGKSTALGLLSLTCFNGSGFVSGSSSEASLVRRACSSKGFFTVDHYEETRKSREKRQIYTQFLENAWNKNTMVDKINTETHEVEQFKVASSVAIGTRETDDVLEEKGIVIKMVETKDLQKRIKSSKMNKDTYFESIQERCMVMALNYQHKIVETYENSGEIPELVGRDYNKFMPLIALAQVIDFETDSKYKLYDKVVNWGISYRQNRKADLKDTEEVMLKAILENQIEITTYGDLSELLKEEGFENYSLKNAKSDLAKLQITKRRDKSKKPMQIHIDLNRASKRAESRGLTWKNPKTDTQN